MTLKNYLDVFKKKNWSNLSIFLYLTADIRTKLFKEYSQISNYFTLRCKNNKL